MAYLFSWLWEAFLSDFFLEIPRFLDPINKGAPYFLGHILAFSHFRVSLPALDLYRRCVYHQSLFFIFLIRRCICHRSLFFAFLVTDFKIASDLFLPLLRVLIPNSSKFSTTHPFFCNAYCSSLDRVGGCLVR